MIPKTSVLITGASSGIGAVYADRFARRGHDLVLVARDRPRMQALARKLRRETGVGVEVLVADLTDESGLTAVAAQLEAAPGIGILVNNAGMSLHGGFLDQQPEELAKLISLNVTALTRLARAAGERFVQAGEGAIVNIGSVLGFAPEIGLSAYGATKAFVQVFSQGLALELGPRGVYVQAVLPSATRTEIWEKSGRDVDAFPGVMDAGELVDAAMIGFDRREAVSIPSLPDEAQWLAFDAARREMLPTLIQPRAAERYREA